MIRPTQHHHFKSVYRAELLEEYLCDDVEDVLLVERVRETGVLDTDTEGGAFGFGSPWNGWYNPGVSQNYEREATRGKRRAQREAWAKAHEKNVKAKDAKIMEAAAKVIFAPPAPPPVYYDAAAHERQNVDARRREEIERRCWEIANEAAAYWSATETETKLMWNMMRFMNLGLGAGRLWSADGFAALVHVPVIDVQRCYTMLRERPHARG